MQSKYRRHDDIDRRAEVLALLAVVALVALIAWCRG
jgi:hypothetical protein